MSLGIKVFPLLLIAGCTLPGKEATESEAFLERVIEIARSERFEDIQAISKILDVPLTEAPLSSRSKGPQKYFVPFLAMNEDSTIRRVVVEPGFDLQISLTSGVCVTMADLQQGFQSKPMPFVAGAPIAHSDTGYTDRGFKNYVVSSRNAVVGVDTRGIKADATGCATSFSIGFRYGPDADQFRQDVLGK